MHGHYEVYSEKIRDGDEKKQLKAQETIQHKRALQERDIQKVEVTPSTREKEMIQAAEAAVDAFIRQLGADAAHFPANSIHVVRPGSIEALSPRHKGAYCALLEQYCVVERQPSETAFALTVVHELLHLKSPKMIRIYEDPQNPRLYRAGLMMTARKKADPSGAEYDYFARLEEGIVAEASNRIFDVLSKQNESVRAEVTLFASIKPWLDKLMLEGGHFTSQKRAEMLGGLRAIPIEDARATLEKLESQDVSDDEKLTDLHRRFLEWRRNGAIAEAERADERRKLRILVDDLSFGSNGRFSREQIMTRFFEANFTGSYLALARTVEEILGKGSFRQLAEAFGEERPEGGSSFYGSGGPPS